MSIAKILFVDDETAFLDAMKRRLVKRGFDVETAARRHGSTGNT